LVDLPPNADWNETSFSLIQDTILRPYSFHALWPEIEGYLNNSTPQGAGQPSLWWGKREGKQESWQYIGTRVIADFRKNMTQTRD